MAGIAERQLAYLSGELPFMIIIELSHRKWTSDLRLDHFRLLQFYPTSILLLQVYNDRVNQKADLPRFYRTFEGVTFDSGMEKPSNE